MGTVDAGAVPAFRTDQEPSALAPSAGSAMWTRQQVPMEVPMAEALRVPLSRLKANPGGYLESARSRRVLLTRRGRVVGELVPLDEPAAAPIKPLLGCGRDLLRLDPALDLTEPVEAEWEALR